MVGDLKDSAQLACNFLIPSSFGVIPCGNKNKLPLIRQTLTFEKVKLESTATTIPKSLKLVMALAHSAFFLPRLKLTVSMETILVTATREPW
jgi:hypothetical protein